jgi:translation initiation factor 2B subunit (eIF-2B alpha/beta/delta family)
VGFLVAPYIWVAIGGLIGLIAAVGVFGITWMTKDWLYMKAGNLRLSLIKAEAAENPVETLQSEHLKQSEQLEERRKGLESMNGACRTLDQAIDSLERDFPDSPELPQMRADQGELLALLESRKQDWQDSYISLGQFANEIKRVGKLWEVSLAAARARQQTGLSQDEWMSKLKTQTSIDAIRTKLNTQLSALSTERMQADAQRILKGQASRAAVLPAPSVGIQLPPINIKNVTKS